jgi:hypothetical protein
MAQCKLCGRNGIFLSVNELGLCKNCNAAVNIEVSSRYKVYKDSVTIINSSKNIDTIASRFNIAMEHLNRFKEFEDKDIVFMNPKPSELIRLLPLEKDNRIKELLQSNIQELINKAKLTESPKSQITILTKGLLQIEHAKVYLFNPSVINNIQENLSGIIHQIQLNTYLDNAKRAEFKGSKKKALECYYDALYFLQNDGIDDSLQQNNIKPIETKIAELKSVTVN